MPEQLMDWLGLQYQKDSLCRKWLPYCASALNPWAIETQHIDWQSHTCYPDDIKKNVCCEEKRSLCDPPDTTFLRRSFPVIMEQIFQYKSLSKPLNTPVSIMFTGYANNYDALVLFTCPNEGYLNGVHSVHHNGAEDRIFKFRCCTPRSGNNIFSHITYFDQLKIQTTSTVW